MNKNNFINELKRKLKNMPSQELEEAISYYTEYFEDAQIDDYTDVEKEFGSPSSVASQILADYAIKDRPSKSQISSIWFIILAIFASPIALPLAFAGVILLATLLFVCVAVLFALGIASFSIAFAGGAVFVSGLTIIFNSFSTSILFVGVGMILMGIGILFLRGIVSLSNIFLKIVINITNKALSKLNKKEVI